MKLVKLKKDSLVTKTRTSFITMKFGLINIGPILEKRIL